MASIPISGLNERTTINGEDFIPFVYSSSLTTYRISLQDLNGSYLATSGSVLSASWASASISASHAIIADTASYLYPDRVYYATASWALNLLWDSIVGTASLARTASRLEGIGSSYEKAMYISNSLSILKDGYFEIPARTSITSSVGSITSIKANSVFFNKDYVSGVTDYGKIYIFENNTNQAKLVFEIGDDYSPISATATNIDLISANNKGFLFQTNEAGNTNNLSRTGSLLFISGSGRTYGRIFEAQEFSSSFASSNKVGFYGTSSWSVSSSFAMATSTVFVPGMIMAWAGSTSPSGWLKCDGSVYNELVYSALAAQIGTNYGKSSLANVYCYPESVTKYGTANDGYVKFTWLSGGTGIFSLYWATSSLTYYINSTTNTTHSFTGLNGYDPSGTDYSYVWSDLGVNPIQSFSGIAHIGYGGFPTSDNVQFGVDQYRVPEMNSYFQTNFTLNPLIWIIKT